MEALLTDRPEPCRPLRRLRARSGTGGTSLIELMVALGILALGVVGLMFGFTKFNGYATSARLAASAKALCQERIEQVITQPFHPPSQLPLIDGVSLMGTAANWTTAAAPYTANSAFSFQSTGTVQTSQDNVNVCVQQDGVTTSVAGVRTTTVAVPDTTNSPDLALFNVSLTYTYRSQSYTTAMSTLRASD